MLRFQLFCFTLMNVCLFSDAVQAELEFNRDIRPILSNKCFACHGPDANKREADLRLDQAASATQVRGEYQVVFPGDAEQSELVSRILSHDSDEQMPPPEFNKPLTVEEISLLKQWIVEGAKWQDHWSFSPLTRPELTGLETQVSNHSSIDTAILAELKKRGMDQLEVADPRTLLRRLSFDITGLPPTPEDVRAFELDHSQTSYETAVDQLLQSPHFGERMAIYWLDLVRYADTLGYHGDQERSVSPYRDYVINAFNKNMPFDQFTIENLAGDLLPEPTLDQKVASTYNRLNRASGEGGVQPKEYLAKYVSDRVRTTGAVWLGTTIGCAECHDHKFDPFTTKDFYSFGAFFADVKEQGIVSGANYIEQMPVPTPEQSQQEATLKDKLASLQNQYDARSPELEAAYVEWQSAGLKSGGLWEVITPVSATGDSGTTLTILEDKAVLASGTNPDRETYQVKFQTMAQQIAAVRIEILPDSSLPNNGPGRAGNGNLVVNAIGMTSGDQTATWKTAVASHSQDGFEAKQLAENNSQGWALLPETGKAHQLILVAKEPLQLAELEQGSLHSFQLTIQQNHGSNHTIGKFRVHIATEPLEANEALASTEMVELLKLGAGERSAEQEQQLFNMFRASTPLLKNIREELALIKKQLTDLQQSVLTTLVTVSTTPREMRVLPRGDWMNDTGEIVQPAVPTFLSQSDPAMSNAERRNRLDLAKWLVARENPLVARTFVNRLWMLFFGQGLSRSVDDLGSQGEWPTHPELIDWLAVEFIENGWNVKHMIKLIVMSHTYRLSSTPTAQLQKRDPYNYFYGRQSRWRLDAEMVRDNALSISDLLVTQVGGKSARPYQPAGYWDQLNFPKRTYQHDTNQNQYRRGLYTHWQRTFLHPSMLAFDAPSREECTAQRERSNTPLQALVLLNDPTYVEAARVFAEHIVQQATAPEDRLNWAYQKAMQRNANDEELAVLSGLLEQQVAYYTSNPEEANKLAASGLAPSANADTIEVAAWTGIARVILNLKETITRY